MKEPAQKKQKTVDINRSLHEADRENNIPLLLELLNQGADINSQDETGFTILHNAAYRGDAGIVKFYLEKSANPNILDNQGHTALSWALVSNHIESANLLIPNRISLQELSNLATHFPDNLESFKFFKTLYSNAIENNVSIDFANYAEFCRKKIETMHKKLYSNLTNPLEILSTKDIKVIEEAIDDSLNIYNLPPEAISYQGYNLELAKLLLKHGASPNCFLEKVVNFTLVKHLELLIKFGIATISTSEETLSTLESIQNDYILKKLLEKNILDIEILRNLINTKTINETYKGFTQLINVMDLFQQIIFSVKGSEKEQWITVKPNLEIELEKPKDYQSEIEKDCIVPKYKLYTDLEGFLQKLSEYITEHSRVSSTPKDSSKRASKETDDCKKPLDLDLIFPGSSIFLAPENSSKSFLRKFVNLAFSSVNYDSKEEERLSLQKFHLQNLHLQNLHLQLVAKANLLHGKKVIERIITEVTYLNIAKTELEKLDSLYKLLSGLTTLKNKSKILKLYQDVKQVYGDRVDEFCTQISSHKKIDMDEFRAALEIIQKFSWKELISEINSEESTTRELRKNVATIYAFLKKFTIAELKADSKNTLKIPAKLTKKNEIINAIIEKLKIPNNQELDAACTEYASKIAEKYIPIVDKLASEDSWDNEGHPLQRLWALGRDPIKYLFTEYCANPEEFKGLFKCMNLISRRIDTGGKLTINNDKITTWINDEAQTSKAVGEGADFFEN